MSFLKKLDLFMEEREYEGKIKGISKRLRDNPKNEAVMIKLRELYNQREGLKVALEKKEVEIDFCLNFLYYNDL
jgi:hypothetical protein